MAKTMTEDYSQTEQLIIDAARDVFSRKGFYGARMQEIAEQAGINKALLHYYFRNKNKLFEKIFEKVIKELTESLFNLEVKPGEIDKFLYIFAENYIDFFRKNEFIPQFVIQEIRENPEWLTNKFDQLKITEKVFFKSIFSIMEDNKPTDMKVYEPFLNMISMLIFPIIARPIIQTILKIDDRAYDSMIESRKKSVPELIIKSLKLGV